MVTNKAQETFAQHHSPGFIVFIVPWHCWWLHWGGSFFISFQCRADCGTLFDFDEKLWLGWNNIFAWLHVLVQAPLLYNIICVYIPFLTLYFCAHLLEYFFEYAPKFCTSYTHGHIALWLHSIWFDSFFIRKWLKCPNKQIQYPNNEKKRRKNYIHFILPL